MDYVFKCDGKADCWDKKDEYLCEYDACALGDEKIFRCKNKHQCVLAHYVCDGTSDCHDGSDELGCESKCIGFECENNHFCLPYASYCDGNSDCEDNSDERNCANQESVTEADDCRNHFSCGDGTCITNLKSICDGRPDCTSGRDEDPTLCTQDVDCKMCSQECFTHQRGNACRCRKGWKLGDDGRSCNNINECAESNVCSQICVDIPGLYRCSCAEGYTLVNGSICQSSAAPLYVWYRQRGLNKADFSELLIKIGDRVHQRKLPLEFSEDRYTVAYQPSIVFDFVREEAYILASNRVYRLALFSSTDAPPQVSVPSHVSVRAFAVDLLTRNIYILNNDNKRVITICSFDQLCARFLSERRYALEKPIVANLPSGRRLFWNEAGHAVVSSDIDGDECRTELQHWSAVFDLIVDETSARFYVALTSGVVEFDLKTKRRRQIGISHSYQTMSVIEHRLLVQMPHVRNQGIEFVFHEFNRLTRRYERPSVANPPGTQLLFAGFAPAGGRRRLNACWNSPCSHVCVSSGSSLLPRPTCLCPPGMSPNRDNSCTRQPDTDEVFYLNGSTLTTYGYRDGILYQHQMTDLRRTPTAIATDGNGTFFVAQQGKKGLLSVQQTGAGHKEHSQRLRFVRSLAYDPVDKVVYAIDGSDRLLAMFLATDKTAVIKRNSTIVHVDIDPIRRMLYFDSFDGILRSMVIGDWELVSSEDVLEPSTTGQKTWNINPYDGSVLDNAVVLQHFYCYLVDSTDTGFDCKSRDEYFDRGDDYDGGSGLLGRSSPLPSAMPPSACTTENACELCVTGVRGSTACLCPYGHVLGVDGETCSNECDEESFLRCPLSNKCIDKTSRCDGQIDCEDGSDEVDCDRIYGCGKGYFECDSGACISSSFRCDGQPDCSDRSDELGCGAKNSCASDEFRCNDGICIPGRQRCDGTTDCFQGDDEFACPENECSEMEFRCLSGQCVPLKAICDDNVDCHDFSDEAHCRKNVTRIQKQTALQTLSLATLTCDSKRYMCCDNGERLPLGIKCNGYADCDDQSDEKGCVIKCSPPMFDCGDGNCLPQDEVCDGIQQCHVGLDEMNCHGKCHMNDLFECRSSGRCLPLSKVCDQVVDCPDASDEAEKNCPGRLLTSTELTN
ncbi:low-density lipoprotein receptor-related protein 2-like, partial [Tropilaelaps mercedesae]